MFVGPCSAKRSVALFTSKPMVFLNAATIRPNNHIQALKIVHQENFGVLLFATIQENIKARDHQLINAIVKNLKDDADRDAINPSRHLNDGLDGNAL